MINDLAKNVFINTSYRYFPRNLEGTYSSQYENSPEFVLLKDTCKFFETKDDFWKGLLKELQGLFPNNKIRDISLLSWLDRSYTVDIILNRREKVVSVLSLSLSIIVPFYNLTYVENDSLIGGSNIPLSSFEINNYQLSEESKKIQKLLGMNNYYPFPKELLKEVIPEVAFRTIPLNSFTFFNAFFLDEIVNRC